MYVYTNTVYNNDVFDIDDLENINNYSSEDYWILKRL